MAINFSDFCKDDFIFFWSMIKKYFEYNQQIENLEENFSKPLKKDYELLTNEIASSKNCVDDRDKINIDRVIFYINDMITQSGCEAKDFQKTDFIRLFDEIKHVNNIIDEKERYQKEERERYQKEKKEVLHKEIKLERKYKISLILLYILPFLILSVLIVSLISTLKDYIMGLVVPAFFFFIIYYYIITTKRDDIRYFMVDKKMKNYKIKEINYLKAFNIKENLALIDEILNTFLKKCIELFPKEKMIEEKDKILKEMKNIKEELNKKFPKDLRNVIFLFSALILGSLERELVHKEDNLYYVSEKTYNNIDEILKINLSNFRTFAQFVYAIQELEIKKSISYYDKYMTNIRLEICKTCSKYYQCKSVKNSGVCVNYDPSSTSIDSDSIPYWFKHIFW